MAYIGTSGDRDSQLVPRNVLKDFTDDVLVISAGSYSCIVSLIGRYNTSIAETHRHGHVALCGLDGLKWIAWERPWVIMNMANDL